MPWPVSAYDARLMELDFCDLDVPI